MGPQPGTGVVNVRHFGAEEWRESQGRIYMTGQILVGVAGWGGRLLYCHRLTAKQETSKGKGVQ